MFLLRIIFSIAAVVPLNFELCFCACARAEYEIDGECCPMCAPGNHVYWHCTVDTSTTCVPCLELTYTDEPNGLMKCLSCSVCDAGQGLRVKKACTRSSNTVCEPLEGFYCIDKNKGSCTLAVKHSKCNPGKYIKQAGTASTDTVCDDCTDGTYSNGSFSSCLAHSKCEALGLTEINPGTDSSDAECVNSSPHLAVIAIGTVILFALVIVIVCVCFFFQKQSKWSVIGSRENAEPNSLRLEDRARLKNPNLESVSVSCVLTNDFTHTEETVKPEHQRLNVQIDFKTENGKNKNVL